MPRAKARRPRAPPIRPTPRMPSVLPSSSIPSDSSFFGHVPDFKAASACGILRARAKRRPRESSATETVGALGVLRTAIPLDAAAGKSMLSVPTPARTITRSLRPAAICRSPSFVAERTTMAS